MPSCPCTTRPARSANSIAPWPARAPLQGLPVGVKDIFDSATLPTAYGSPIYARHQPRSDAAIVQAIRRAGRRGGRQDQHHRVRVPQPDAHPQPERTRPHARRVVGGFGGRGGCRAHPARRRHADRWLGHPAGLVLRRGRLQADLRRAAHAGPEALLVVARHRRPVHALGRRDGALVGPHRRPRLAGARGSRTGVRHRLRLALGAAVRQRPPGARDRPAHARSRPAPPCERSSCRRGWPPCSRPTTPCRAGKPRAPWPTNSSSTATSCRPSCATT
jgi:hypothetical protein